MLEILAWALVVVLLSLSCVAAALSVYNYNMERKYLLRISKVADLTVEAAQLRYTTTVENLSKDGEHNGE